MNRAFLSVVFLCLALSVAFAVDSGFQDYSSGFYTKGLDTAVNFDSGSETYDPYYLPAADWSIAPRLTLTVTWDDNLFLSNENPESAELIDLIPGVMAIYGRPDHNYLYLDAGTIYHVYDSSGNLEDQSDYLVTLGSVYKTGKSTLDGGIGFRRSETADTVIGQRILKDDYSFNLSLGHQLSEKNSGLVGYSASFSSYNDEELNDNQNQQILLRLARKVSDASDVYGQFDAGRDDVDAEGDLGDAEYYGLAIGFTGKQSAKLTLSGDIGYQWRKIIEDDTETVEDVTSSLGINYNPFGFTVIYANFDSTISPAINSLGQTTIDQRYTLGLNRRLFVERLRGNISFFYGTYDYLGTPVDSAANLNRQDDYFGYNLGLDYYTIKNFSLGLTYSYFENEGNQNVSSEERKQTAYDSGRWVFRASWNY